MAIPYRLLALLVLPAILACGQTPKETNEARVTIRPAIQKQLPEPDRNLDEIIVGRFCGECGNNCATMYRYNMMGNMNSLFVDYTDSYFKGEDSLVFGTQITDLSKFEIAADIVRHIPESLLTTTESAERFGCPDCTDGCGIYLEMFQDGKSKKFYIDYQTQSLTGEIRTFADYLKTAIPKLSVK